MTRKLAAFGSWQSPIGTDLIAGQTIGLDQPRLDGEITYWIEKRPAENGRQVIVMHSPSHEISDVIASPFSARSRVHEYGGGVYTVCNGEVYFVNDSDQGIYRTRSGATPDCVFSEQGLRFADIVVDEKLDRLICVCEDHRGEGEPENRLVEINLSSREIATLHSGYDFYASPTLGPDGRQLAWLAWRHPDMPWDSTDLLLAQLSSGGEIEPAQVIAGGDRESVFQPRWSPDGRLYFVSDRTGWWNLYRYESSGPEILCEFDAEFGLPQWVFGMSTYAFQSPDQIICAYCQQGAWSLAIVCCNTGELQRVDTPYQDISGVQATPSRAVYLGGSPSHVLELAEISLPGRVTGTIRQSNKVDIDPGYLSVAEPVSFPTSEEATAYGFFYAPTNKSFAGPEHLKPPLIVISHGGPTAATGSTLNFKVQFWTSRGFGVLDVNYRGSTGYGRAYREQLNGNWGVADVADCEAGVRYLAERGDIDPERAIIRGSSAGGYTTLCALTFGHTFKAGASLYGIGDLETLVRDTHKFEARYLDRLVGPYPEQQALYQARSPIHAAERLSCPVIFLQGLEDKVVPPSQAEAMVAVLRAKGIAVAYVTFESEQHGFRRAASIARALEAELYFYGKVFGFEPADDIVPVAIDNLTE
ncbi:MAG: peptidase [Acidithiobacillales bacterium SG8_45]|nr:MAG: peptidase [Acidithiobacillales bacterium SG8_45]